jgi:Z1 domain
MQASRASQSNQKGVGKMSDPFMVAVGLIGERDLTEEVLSEVMDVLAILPATKSADLASIKKQLEATIGVSMRPGDGLSSGDNPPWVEDLKASDIWHYWGSYTKQLKAEGLGAIVRTLDEDTDNILNECGNPTSQSSWRFQGLVMGDVQSGKTASYCGLISKAADAGYKVIVLMTGTIEELRSQSQERLDEGFVGKDSRAVLKGETGAEKIGAGRFRSKIANVLTSIDSDFLTANNAALRGIPLENVKEPVLLVMKKNKTALEKLISYLNSQKPRGAKHLSLPLLLVDDEADNASVNSKKDETPAAINSLIRQLLGEFRQATYVAYTATPFANVFINPEGSDLFPKNFVYSLNAPTNYIGASEIFSDNGKNADQLVDISDAEAIIPHKHDKALEIGTLPHSLEDAIGVFLLSCAIRDLRKEPLKHRSMLVNVTRFTDVQVRLAAVVKVHLHALVEDIKQYLADDLWRRHSSLARLHELYVEHYATCGAEWDSVRAKLYDSTASIKVLTINQLSDVSERLNFRAYKNTEKGRRAIAIGGLTLSRGLTLEGLCVSYFYRNSKAYDTLLQMGRWFGYRPGYAELCRIWMAPEAQDWFSHIAEVVAELRGDIRHMHKNRLPPIHFGMKVKSHPGALLVTAANKMRNSSEVEVKLSFGGRAVATPFLPRSTSVNSANVKVTSVFLKSLGASEAAGNRHVWRGVGASRIANFLQQLEIPPMNSEFIPDQRTGEKPLITFIRNNRVNSLGEWDVCIANGGGAPAEHLEFVGPSGSDVQIKKRQRQFEKPLSKLVTYLKINKQRVGEIADEKVLLSDEQICLAESQWLAEDEGERQGKTIPGKAYLAVRQRPLLTIHPIEPTEPEKDAKNADRMMELKAIDSQLFIAIGLSFPKFAETDATSVPYRLNKVYLQKLGLLEEEGDDED